MKKNYYYVLVYTNKGPKFVTKFGDGHVAYWEDDNAPKEMGKSLAYDVCLGLNMNGFTADVVVSPHEKSFQPYNYEFGSFEWKQK